MAIQVGVLVAKVAAGVAETVGKDKETGKFSLGKLALVLMLIILVPVILIASVITYIVTLPFGAVISFFLPDEFKYENVFPQNVYYEQIGDYPLPCDTEKINSDFGQRDNPFESGTNEKHTGIDFGATWHSPVIAISQGIVTHTGYKASYGRCVIVEYEEFTAIYAHLAKSYAVKGGKVSYGMVLGTVGGDPNKDTLVGDSTGAHLHFELRKEGKRVDPYPYLFEKTVKREEDKNDISEPTNQKRAAA